MEDFKGKLDKEKEINEQIIEEKEHCEEYIDEFSLSKYQRCLERKPSIQTEKTHIHGTFSSLMDEKCIEITYSDFLDKKGVDMSVISQKKGLQKVNLDYSKDITEDSEKEKNMDIIYMDNRRNNIYYEGELEKEVKENYFENVSTFKQESKLLQSLDFRKFITQLRCKSAISIAKYMKSFIYEFLQKPWTIKEKVKIIHDFLGFIYLKMRHVEPWINTSEIEFDNAKEGMEKLITTRLYEQIFSPAIPYLFDDVSGHSDDLERDRIIHEKISMFSWVKEEHIEVPYTNLNQKFLELAGQELLKINSYRSPRDKIFCILNCSKVIFGLLRYAKIEESADKFIPTLILIILKTNPEHLISNIQYISRFRNPDKLSGESEYYFSSLIAAVAFIENLDKSSLTISNEEFEKNLEHAIIRISQQKNKDNKIKNTQSMSFTLLGPAKEYIASKSSNVFRNIQKPLLSLGKIFMDQNTEKSYQPIIKQLSPNQIPQNIISTTNLDEKRLMLSKINTPFPMSKITTVQETQGEIDSETLNFLSQMFPSLDLDVIAIIIDSENGKINPTIDILLTISSDI
ncbi:hypothetical protein T552_01840 [Pneumocystis carinii B80]|uniref:VPS9 domain-containing protein n=1 Tax=Pneumocystis carinii (strain B80) TaxID=1408658 RepID=A0A0W4ZJM8_PNEC8|nr:hypothetical protein T552_01840 [Pneumocystis carinii B80]KTW28579.1 hypothetical protein T552_01840 [Pneumocystis carinii B80]